MLLYGCRVSAAPDTRRFARRFPINHVVAKAMSTIDDDQGRETQGHIHKKAVQGSLIWPVIALSVSVMTLALLFWRGCNKPPAPPAPPLPPTPMTKLDETFFDSSIRPLERENQRANREAADRCIARIAESFEQYRAGVDGFCEEITGIGTRFGVLRRMPANWWYEHDTITPYINRKFEKHIFSEDQLKKDLGAALAAFREDLRANRGSLLSAVKVAVSESMLPHMEMPDYDAFDRQVVNDLSDYAARRAEDSVYQGIVSLIASEVAAVAATDIVTRLMATFAYTAALEATAAGGAAAGGAAAGGAGGTVAGPVGTAIGAGVGLVVGILVDWWMTDSFKAKLSDDLDEYLVKLRDGIIDGDTNGGVQPTPGLRDTLSQYCEDLAAAQSSVLHDHLVGENE